MRSHPLLEPTRAPNGGVAVDQSVRPTSLVYLLT
jgi:hypothetical protein